MNEPTRPLPNPELNQDGSWKREIAYTPAAIKTRGRITLPSRRVIPVIVVPGIMGTNLRATTDPSQEQNKALKPGEVAWRPPNGMLDGLDEAKLWKHRSPVLRQKILDPATLEVDDSGEIDLALFAFADGLHEGPLRKQSWGEIHWSTYGDLLVTLENNLNTTFTMFNGFRALRPHWVTVNQFDRHHWGLIGRETELTAPITEAEFEKFAGYYYPVHACGYNWLQSCEQAAAVLKKRIEEVIAFYASYNKTCIQVILVTHSMGGLVARACAKAIPDKIAGIVHGAMPALGAPVCNRRIACGTESTSPSAGAALTASAAGFRVRRWEACPSTGAKAGNSKATPIQAGVTSRSEARKPTISHSWSKMRTAMAPCPSSQGQAPRGRSGMPFGPVAMTTVRACAAQQCCC